MRTFLKLNLKHNCWWYQRHQKCKFSFKMALTRHRCYNLLLTQTWCAFGNEADYSRVQNGSEIVHYSVGTASKAWALTSTSILGLEALSETTVVGFAADKYCTWYPGASSCWMVLVVTSRYVRMLPGVVMPFIAADEDGRDTLVCKSSNRASSNRLNELLHSCYFCLIWNIPRKD